MPLFLARNQPSSNQKTKNSQEFKTKETISEKYFVILQDCPLQLRTFPKVWFR